MLEQSVRPSAVHAAVVLASQFIPLVLVGRRAWRRNRRFEGFWLVATAVMATLYHSCDEALFCPGGIPLG